MSAMGHIKAGEPAIQEGVLVDTEEVRQPCSLRHQRLEKVEALAAKTALTVHGHALDIQHLGSRVNGLAHAHDATLVAVRASTDASTRLSQTLERVDSRLDCLMTDYSAHKVDAERDKRTWPRLAIWLWTASLTAGVSLFLWVASNWRFIIDFIQRA